MQSVIVHAKCLIRETHTKHFLSKHFLKLTTKVEDEFKGDEMNQYFQVLQEEYKVSNHLILISIVIARM